MVQADVAAVGTGNGDKRDAPPERQAAVIGQGLQQGLIAGNYPVCIAADRAGHIWIDGVEDSLESLGVHNTPA